MARWGRTPLAQLIAHEYRFNSILSYESSNPAIGTADSKSATAQVYWETQRLLFDHGCRAGPAIEVIQEDTDRNGRMVAGLYTLRLRALPASHRRAQNVGQYAEGSVR